MKIATILAVAIAALTSIPLLGQQADANANVRENAAVSTNGTRATEGYGDEAASHSWEMSSITGELEGKLDSKTAKPGEPVVLKTIQKVQTSDGTIIPKGSRLIGHITQVQSYRKGQIGAQIAVTFDRVEMKNGQSVAIYTLLRGVTPGIMAMNSMNNDGAFGSPMGASGPMGGPGAMGGPGGMGGAGTMGGDPAMGGGGMGGRQGGGVMGGAGGAINGVGNGVGGVAGGTLDGAGQAATQVDDRMGAGLGSTQNTAVQAAGHGDQNLNTGAHALAAERSIPRPTGIPGINLAGSATASGLLLASGRNIELQGGTQMQLGIVAK